MARILNIVQTVRGGDTNINNNNITMHEYNLERIKAKPKALEEPKIKNWKRKMELEEKAALMEIAIRVNELSIETRFGGSEKRFEELEMASRRQNSSFYIKMKQRPSDQMNSFGNDEKSTESDIVFMYFTNLPKAMHL